MADCNYTLLLLAQRPDCAPSTTPEFTDEGRWAQRDGGRKGPAPSPLSLDSSLDPRHYESFNKKTFIEHPGLVYQGPLDFWSRALHNACCPSSASAIQAETPNDEELESSLPGDCPSGASTRRRIGCQQLQHHHPLVQRPSEEAGEVWRIALTGGMRWGLVSSVRFTFLINSSC